MLCSVSVIIPGAALKVLWVSLFIFDSEPRHFNGGTCQRALTAQILPASALKDLLGLGKKENDAYFHLFALYCPLFSPFETDKIYPYNK